MTAGRDGSAGKDGQAPVPYAQWYRSAFPELADSVIAEAWRMESPAVRQYWTNLAARPSDAALTGWIENHPAEFAAWVDAQRSIGGVAPVASVMAARPARDAPSLLADILDDYEAYARMDITPQMQDKFARWREQAGHPAQAAFIDYRCDHSHHGDAYRMTGSCRNCRSPLLALFSVGHKAAFGISGPSCPVCGQQATSWTRLATPDEIPADFEAAR